MSEKKGIEVLLNQLEEALEERQQSERRKHSDAESPQDIKTERRVNDRRNGKTH